MGMGDPLSQLFGSGWIPTTLTPSRFNLKATMGLNSFYRFLRKYVEMGQLHIGVLPKFDVFFYIFLRSKVRINPYELEDTT